ncbi:MAG TPA: YdeI/OmpD-associated family protein [Vicinamibacterales bacterium]|nr:YdeI/OmpD-associated family protein [Vicinamibacterales bacterium]
MKFKAKVIPSGNATGIEVPKDVVEALRSGARPAITVTINGHAWRSRVARMRGQCLVGISAANRVASGIAEGDIVVVDLKLDTAPRVVAPPPDLARALRNHPEARLAFDRLAFGLKRKHVGTIDSAKTPETRQRRIAKLVTSMSEKARA